MYKFCAICIAAVGTLAALHSNPVFARDEPEEKTPSTPGASPKTGSVSPAEKDKTLYALGVLISRNLDNFQLSPAEFERVKAGIIDGVNHRAAPMDLAVETQKVQELGRDRAALVEKSRLQQAQSYLDKAAATSGAHKTASGVVMIPIRAGNGQSPAASDQVTVNYTGKLIDGTVFDSTSLRGQPATFGLAGVIPCWSEALTLMKVGEKSRVVCPPSQAYGARGAPPRIGPQAALDFEVELLAVVPGSAPSGGATK